MHLKWFSSLPDRNCVFLALLLQILFSTNVVGLQLFKTRQVMYRMLGYDNFNEERLHLERCRQSSSSGNCNLAIDGSIVQEWTQCVSTVPELSSFWKAELETPSYIARVVIHTAKLPDEAMLNAMHDFGIYAGDSTCYRHISSQSFITRSFPCDAMADRILIRSFRVNSIMSLCEIEVYGKPLTFQGLDSGEAEIGFSGCLMSSSAENSKCEDATDRNFAVFHGQSGKKCALTLPGEEEYSRSWLSVYLMTPTLIKHVKVYNRMDKCCNNLLNKFAILVNSASCAVHESIEPFISKVFRCTRFGNNVKLESRVLKSAITVCQIQVFGYKTLLYPDVRHEHKGCFHDDPDNPEMEQVISYSFMEPRKCHRMCKRLNKLYFGLQNGRACLCGNKYGRYGSAAIEKCNLGCVNDGGMACGGRNFTTVYEILV
ncbi:hypothetical protein BOX15_Mlig025061g2 [Macrostomum lignano]|uniref:Uncharacterized protein n=2 Tax=Macrostomum lignano TaxID=282301 RepID=A0A267ERV5_9PLAT|nr:hypothetical protein BOX15_Mlig025061g2 [Macrostomum lignano]